MCVQVFGRMFAVGVVGLSVAALPAKADLTFEAVGDPVDADSWLQAFSLHTDNHFRHLGLALTPWAGDVGSGFESDAWDFDGDGNSNGFEQVGWGHGPSDSMWTYSSGGATNDLPWGSHFSNDRGQQHFLLTLFAWGDDFNPEIAAGGWDGNTWSMGTHPPGVSWDDFTNWCDISRPVVPVPSSALLGLLGLGLAGGFCRRWR